MRDWITFEGCVVPMQWGDSVYTILPLPDDVYEKLKAQKTKRVEIELNDYPFNMALTKAPMIDHVFVYAGKSVLAEASIQPGDPIDVRLRKTDPNVVEVPPEVTSAVLKHGLVEIWEEVTPGKKRGYIHMITSAKRSETRAKRIAQLIDELQNSAP